jgi:2-polyprenyl-3-methyl-5-hydroxy-6-metoxy-1,4-benzoquinol methylase
LEDPFYGFADSYLSKVGTFRAVVFCHDLVARQPSAHLPQPPARVAYIGGGAGHQSIPLAQEGYEVTLLDPSRAMLWRPAGSLNQRTREGEYAWSRARANEPVRSSVDSRSMRCCATACCRTSRTRTP